MKNWSILVFLFVWTACVRLNNDGALQNGIWRGVLQRTDSAAIVFNFEVKDSLDKKIIYVLNAGEHLLVDDVKIEGDSVFIKMPLFDSEFKALLQGDGSLKGQWIRHLPVKDMVMPFIATPHTPYRFTPSPLPPAFNVTGRWATHFVNEKNDTSFSVGEFKQVGNHLTGTFLVSTGDYRFLEGQVSGDSLFLSTFDGSHAYLFRARIANDSMLVNGSYLAGATARESWTAKKDAKAVMPDAYSLTALKEGENRLNFAFPDIDGRKVSINDTSFKGKVLVIQLMGSWCPNCMDETNFLSSWYKQNRKRGVEVIGLAYERFPDFEKAKIALLNFKKRFDVQYPLLITGVAPGDSLKTEKTLPQLKTIVGFPTTIFVDKNGRVRKIHTGFTGPGTGEHYRAFIREFNALINQLLNEKS